jgi:hypothetical protein
MLLSTLTLLTLMMIPWFHIDAVFVVVYNYFPHYSLMVMMLLPLLGCSLLKILGLAKLLLFYWYWVFGPKIAFMSRKDPIKISYQEKLKHEVKIDMELLLQAHGLPINLVPAVVLKVKMWDNQKLLISFILHIQIHNIHQQVSKYHIYL